MRITNKRTKKQTSNVHKYLEMFNFQKRLKVSFYAVLSFRNSITLFNVDNENFVSGIKIQLVNKHTFKFFVRHFIFQL